MMYEATKVEGVPEKVPRELRGVYWMKGNPVPEELMVIQHAQWRASCGVMERSRPQTRRNIGSVAPGKK